MIMAPSSRNHLGKGIPICTLSEERNALINCTLGIGAGRSCIIDPDCSIHYLYKKMQRMDQILEQLDCLTRMRRTSTAFQKFYEGISIA